MLDYTLISAVLFGIALLLILILFVRIHAFISLLIASISVGLIAGMDSSEIITTMANGMGSTLGFVAVVVGLGAMFGAILEQSGSANLLANKLLKLFGEKKASWAMVLTGFIIAIPVFFDVAFIILVPLIYALQRKSKKSLLLYALPLLAGLAITHAFIPPTPGPVAVADILNANLGWVIVFGFIVGIPTAIFSGPVFAKFISEKIQIEAPAELKTDDSPDNLPSLSVILLLIAIPIVLIVGNTLSASDFIQNKSLQSLMTLLGHPFTALIIANLLAWYFLGIRKGYSRDQLLKVSGKSMEPAGIIILLTGAGGVFKQMLVDTGAGTMLAEFFTESGISLILVAFVSACIVRLLQGSATVAMITAAGLTAPLLPDGIGEMQKALLVIAIAAGATTTSHVNDSGFWLVSKYLGLSEKQTFKSWTVMTTIIAITGFIAASIIYALL